MRSQRPDNPFDAMRRVIEREANQDDDNGFFAKLGDIEPDHAPTGHSLGLFQHWDTERGGPAFKWPPRDNGGKLPTGLTPIRNTTGHGILISTYPRFDPSNYFNVRISIEEYNRTKHLQAVILHHRYWHDHQGQPRRNTLMRPLLHNGKACRK